MGPFNNGGNMMGKIMQAMQMFPQFIQNPVGSMLSSGLNIPPNIRNNPGAILNYLQNSGQMSQEQRAQAEQWAQLAQPFLGKKL